MKVTVALGLLGSAFATDSTTPNTFTVTATFQIPTTTITPYDSSSGSSGTSSDSLNSASLNTGALASDSSDSYGSSGSNQSGSSGYYLPIWMWLGICALCCCKGALIAALCGNKNTKKATKKKAVKAAPAPAPA